MSSALQLPAPRALRRSRWRLMALEALTGRIEDRELEKEMR